jgi:hypothetical protein
MNPKHKHEFHELELPLRKICKACRCIASICGHIDCRNIILDDCTLIEEVCNYGQEGFEHITLPSITKTIDALQRLTGQARSAIAVISNPNLTYQDIIRVEDKITGLSTKLRENEKK